MERNPLLEWVEELLLEEEMTADDVLNMLPSSHRQFERIYRRDPVYSGSHPKAIEGLTTKPAVPKRVYRLFYPGKQFIGWADYSGKDGKLKVHRKGEWTEPKSSIPDERVSELQRYLATLTEAQVIGQGRVWGSLLSARMSAWTLMSTGR